MNNAFILNVPIVAQEAFRAAFPQHTGSTMTQRTKTVSIIVELDDDVAYQLAQFCKRSTFNQFCDLTEAHLSKEERNRRAYQMIAGIETVARALAEVGIDPR